MALRPTTVTIHGKRAPDFERVFGTTTVQAKGPIPRRAELPGFDEPQEVYELDLGWVNEQGHRGRLVDHIAERFGQPRAFVERELENVGMPILASEATVVFDMRYVL